MYGDKVGKVTLPTLSLPSKSPVTSHVEDVWRSNIVLMPNKSTAAFPEEYYAPLGNVATDGSVECGRHCLRFIHSFVFCRHTLQYTSQYQSIL